MRLIDADALTQNVLKEYGIDTWVASGREIYDMIKAAPTVDAVQVVHCKDCKYSDTYNLSDEPTDMPLKCLGIRYGGVYENFFCEHGERK